MQVNLLDWYFELPIITRVYFTGTFLLTALCSLDVLSPFQLYYSWSAIARGELWRLVTNFFYFGNIGIDFLFHFVCVARRPLLARGGSTLHAAAGRCLTCCRHVLAPRPAACTPLSPPLRVRLPARCALRFATQHPLLPLAGGGFVRAPLRRLPVVLALWHGRADGRGALVHAHYVLRLEPDVHARVPVGQAQPGHADFAARLARLQRAVPGLGPARLFAPPRARRFLGLAWHCACGD